MKNVSELSAAERKPGRIPETTEELRDLLAIQFAEIEAGHIKPEIAKERSNTAGKMLKSAALQIEAAAINKTNVRCKFVLEAE